MLDRYAKLAVILLTALCVYCQVTTIPNCVLGGMVSLLLDDADPALLHTWWLNESLVCADHVSLCKCCCLWYQGEAFQMCCTV